MPLLLLLACAEPDDTATPPARCEAAPRAPEGCGDLDCDGVSDLVIARTEDAEGRYDTTSVVHWGAGGTTELPTLGAADVAVADLDGDDRPDLVFADLSDGEARAVDSYVYWNGADGFAADRRTALPTVGASDVEVADVDGDGWRDLVFANRYDGGSATDEESYRVDVWAYLGGPDGFDPARRLAVPGFGAAQTAAADLDQDGFVDLAIAAGTFHTSESWLYLGGPDGFSEARRVALPTAAPEAVIAADLDDDGWADLVFGNFYAAGDLEIDSTIYWGGPDGPSPDDATGFRTAGADDLAAADLDGDGCLELTVANAMEGTFFELDFTADSEVWGFDGRAMTSRAALPTVSAAAVSVGDLNGDGHPDLAFANRYDEAGGPGGEARVYVGGEDGYAGYLDVPSVGAAGIAIAAPAD